MLANKVQAAAKIVSAASSGNVYIFHGSQGTGANRIKAWPWSSATGFGTAFADPTTSGAEPANPVLTPVGDAVITSRSGGQAWQFSTAGWGAKYIDYFDISQNALAIHPSGHVIISAKGANPFIKAQRWSSVTGFGLEYATPSPILPGATRGCDISPQGDAVVVTWSTASGNPYFHIYPWSNSTGFGAKYADPATGLGVSDSNSAKFSPAGDVILFGTSSSPGLHAYPFSASTGIGVKYANPAVVPSNAINSVTWHPSGNAVAAAGNNTPQVHAYAWSAAGFGTKFANPTTFPAGAGQGIGCAFAPDGQAIAIGLSTSPYIAAWGWSESGFGALYSNPSVLPVAIPLTGRPVAFGTIPTNPIPTDANYSSVSLLLHMNGTNGSTTFTDNSANVFTVTPNGNTQISTAQSKFGGASGLFDGTGDYLAVAHNSVLSLESGNFTIEAWIYRNTSGAIQNIVNKRVSAPASGYVWRINANNTLQFFFTGGSSVTSTATIGTGAWTHIAVTRDANTVRQFINGAVAAPAATFSNGTANTQELRISADELTSDAFDGYIDDLRITKGVSRYPNFSFTAPVYPYPDA